MVSFACRCLTSFVSDAIVKLCYIIAFLIRGMGMENKERCRAWQCSAVDGMPHDCWYELASIIKWKEVVCLWLRDGNFLKS